MRYQIVGEPLSAVICDVEPGETLITERGSMSWMTPNMKMETTSGGFGKAIGRMFAGEALFQNRYTAVGGPGQITFASSFPRLHPRLCHHAGCSADRAEKRLPRERGGR